MLRCVSLILIALLATPVLAKDPPLEGVCAQIDKKINTLLDANISECLPSRGNQKGSYALLVVAKKPVLNNEENRRAWLLSVVGAAGWAMSDLPEMRGVVISEVTTTDTSFAPQKKYLSLSGASVKRWRNQMFTGQLKALDAYAQIQGSIKEVKTQ